VRPHFEHHPDLPVLTDTGVTVTVIMGELGGATSPADVYSSLVGAEAVLASGADVRLPLQPGWEYATLALAESVDVDGVTLAPGPLLYLGSGRSDLSLRADTTARLLLIGGEPFDERIVMWWNFVGRDHAEVAQARADWQAQLVDGTQADGRFGVVAEETLPPIPAPALPNATLRSRG
jgi:redox-sensitive bicupin YhaK (pirin superfamily)